MATLALAQTPFSTHNGRSLTTSPHCLYVNPNQPAVAGTFCFATMQEALRAAEANCNDSVWTEIYIEPSVYWIDDPDDPEVRRPAPGSNTPFGMELRLSHTRLVGLSNDPADVVLASNRGQTQGAEGNFTMLHITGDDFVAENLTFGNYCNVDLVYPRNPQLERKRRKEAIVQAQLVICSGDRYGARNCRFISRLNLCPFAGARHATFDDCYMECTDDALCGTAVYRHCRFTLFSSKPFYSTYAQGATFIDCDLHSKTRGTQYLTKVSGPVVMERCRWTSDDPDLKIEWGRRPDPRHYCAMRECTLNGNPLDVPTPTDPLPVILPAMALANQPDILPGRWTIDAYKPLDTEAYDWRPDLSRPAWGYAEGVDGAEGQWGIVQLQRGARLMFTPADDAEAVSADVVANLQRQECVITLEPCKGPGQGFGSATGQYLDICICFDTRTLTGYGIRLIRTPEYDHAVETYLVAYDHGKVTRITEPQCCDLFRPGCQISLVAEGNLLHVEVGNRQLSDLPSLQLEAQMPHRTAARGFHLQHTGSTGASATVVRTLFLK